MKGILKTWLARLLGLLAFVQASWAVWFYTAQRLTPGESFWSLFLAPGIYLLEIALLAAAAALLPWFKAERTLQLHWALAGAFAALTLSDLWTVGFYLSPTLVLVLINAAFLSPDPEPHTWRSVWVFAVSGAAQFFLNLAPFVVRLVL